ncbi:MAG: hypothetical protein IAF58_11370, partial [Leptolyngbya sp.]|nr:hypothetical protein [Candidatus Melainabacteria bacterium]
MTNSSAPAKPTEGDAKKTAENPDAPKEEEEKSAEGDKIAGPKAEATTGLHAEAANALCTKPETSTTTAT